MAQAVRGGERPAWYTASGARAPASGERHRVYLEMQLNGAPVRCLFDSGCEHTMVPASLVKGWQLQPTTQIMYAANGSKIPLLGQVRIKLALGDMKLDTPALVSNCVHEVMIGIDWLERHDVQWTFGKGAVEVRGQQFLLSAARSARQAQMGRGWTGFSPVSGSAAGTRGTWQQRGYFAGARQQRSGIPSWRVNNGLCWVCARPHHTARYCPTRLENNEVSGINRALWTHRAYCGPAETSGMRGTREGRGCCWEPQHRRCSEQGSWWRGRSEVGTHSGDGIDGPADIEGLPDSSRSNGPTPSMADVTSPAAAEEEAPRGVVMMNLQAPTTRRPQRYAPRSSRYIGRLGLGDNGVSGEAQPMRRSASPNLKGTRATRWGMEDTEWAGLAGMCPRLLAM